MPTITFDTLDYVKKLEKVGFTREQAETQANAIREVVDEKLVTKEHLDMKLKELEYKITIRLGSMLCVAVAVLATIITFSK